MDNNKKCSVCFNNESDDPTYENWLALFACIVNNKLSVSRALSIMGITCDGNKPQLKGGAVYES